MRTIELRNRPPKISLGGLPPRHNFALNPYPGIRISRCPICEVKTAQRKLPLLIHVDPMRLVALNYTCRYCLGCDLLIAHKLEIEHLLRDLFAQREPSAIGNEYLVVGTVEKAAWRDGLTGPKTSAETFPAVHDFKSYRGELRMTRPGWYPADMQPPMWEPPKSQEWVKRSTQIPVARYPTPSPSS